MSHVYLEPCSFCGGDVFDVMYARTECYDKLVINCPHCGEFTIVHDQFRAGKTCYDVWNTRVREVYRYDIHGEDDVDDWSE